MRPLSLLILAALVISALGHGWSCRYWCKTPSHTFFCCSTRKPYKHLEKDSHSFLLPWPWIRSSLPYTRPWLYFFLAKLKRVQNCPPLRPRCPRTYGWYTFHVLQTWHSRMEHCHEDEDCESWEKCCYDVCLHHKTCKSSE